MKYLILTWLFCLQNFIQSDAYYYWKDFQKKIPYDAYSPGQGANEEKVYIGQAFLYDDSVQGVYPTNYPRQTCYCSKILCSTDPENFEWIPVNSTHFHLMDTENELVRGGIELHEWISIGRVKHQGGISIGKVMSADIGHADMWFVGNAKERKVEIFEVLTYKNPTKAKKPAKKS